VVTTTPPKIPTGVTGLDNILDGGIQSGRVYLVEGTPGTGKTTLALQFLIAGREQGESGLYMTLSESVLELHAVASSHGWSLDGIDMFELFSEEGLDPDLEQSVLHPAELELGETTRAVMAKIDESRPTRVVFDSLSEMRLLAQNPLRYRRQVLALKQFFTQRKCTVLLLDDRTSDSGDLQLHSIAHGVILLEQIALAYGAERRRMRVMKLRSTKFRGGWHDYIIERGGLTIFPRLVAHEVHLAFTDGTLSSGSPGLDALMGGGLVRGTNSLLMGPSGAGKTSTATSAVMAALQRGERAAYFLFDEGLPSLLTRSAQLGMDLRPHIESGLLIVRQIDPAEMSPGQFAVTVQEAVEERGAKVVVIDSLNAYLQSMPGEQFLLLQMHELLSYLNQSGVITLMILGQHGLIGDIRTNIDLSYLADSVVLLRFFEVAGVVRKAISVLKTRTTAHEPTIREFMLGPRGVIVGEPLKGFRGVLAGTPIWGGTEGDLMDLGSAAED
jgi:circadian clock protein KaiC